MSEYYVRTWGTYEWERLILKGYVLVNVYCMTNRAAERIGGA